MKITKAIIPVAGYGTRFLPATKVQPKEMMPIVDTPIIEFLVHEAIQSGITDILFVVHPTRSNVDKHFAQHKELEEFLSERGKQDVIDKLEYLHKQANFSYVAQEKPAGNGDAIMKGQSFIGEEPFAAFYADDVVVSKDTPALKQLIDVYDRYKNSVMGLVEVPTQDVVNYGIAKGDEVEDGVIKINSVVEKPAVDEAPSNLASIGRFVLTPDVFEYIQKQPAKNGETYLSEALGELAKEGKVYGKKIDGTWHDCGSKFGLWKANLEMGLEHPEIKSLAQEHIRKMNK